MRIFFHYIVFYSSNSRTNTFVIIILELTFVIIIPQVRPYEIYPTKYTSDKDDVNTQLYYFYLIAILLCIILYFFMGSGQLNNPNFDPTIQFIFIGCIFCDCHRGGITKCTKNWQKTSIFKV